MKKLFLLLTLLLLIIPQNIFADSSTTIQKFDSKVVVEKNGDLKITETVNYKSSKNMNGIYRNIVIKNSDSIENLIIKSDYKKFSPTDKAKNGDSYVYTVTKSDNSAKIKAYIPWTGSINLTFEYTLKNGAILGTDSGIIAYTFLSDIDTKIESFVGTVEVPKLDKFMNYYTENKLNIDEGNGTLTISSDNINSSSISIAASFPKEFISESTNIKNVSSENLDEFFENFPINKDMAKVLSSILIIPSFIFMIVIFIFYSKKDENEKQPIGKFLKLSPSEASVFIIGNYLPSVILATIFDFEKRDFLKINVENYTTKKDKQKENYIFVKTNSPTNLSEDEKYLYDLIFSYGDGKTVSTNQLNSARKSNSMTFMRDFNKYYELVKDELYKKGVIYKKPKYLVISITAMLFSLFAFVMSILLLISKSILAILILPISIIIFILSIMLITKKTPLGDEQYKLYTTLYSELKKVSNFEYKSNDDKQTLLLYAIAFGLKEKALNNLKENLDINSDIFIPIFWNYPMMSTFNYSLIGSTSTSTYYGTSSSGGSTGGGSTGGF
ncbi:DUF2207 domain-containing protein [Peptoniphilus mikwangii]|uniref:DUF2207 domain-containing protein n=1 Tax=Peptoniphilus mikwangii TaxID=1354300 RepID=UPI0004240248|nr:DUF2207 domain-containing protein [Peptoniphilus mikwangii]